MVYLNYTNLDTETQERLLAVSREDVEHSHGKELKRYAKQHHLDYETLLDTEAMRNLYTYEYVFNI